MLKTGKNLRAIALAMLALDLVGNAAIAQQSVPDAPSTVQPPQQFPTAPSAKQTPPADEQPTPQPTGPPADSAPGTDNPPPQMPEVKTVPEGGATPDMPASKDDLFRLGVTVNFVLVPVTVKDETGHMVNGLVPKDFAIFEDGVKQNMRFFTSDPFALSAAIVLDLGMQDSAVQKVNQTFPALEGAFSQFDELSIYAYSNTWSKVSDFSAINQRVTETLNDLKTKRGRNNGPPIVSGPLGPQGPTVNGAPLDPSGPIVFTPPKESHVLNDAVLAAARELSKRDRTRRKVIFIISDGREIGSKSSYRDVMKVLLSNGILVYGVDLGGTGIPGVSKLSKLHLPRAGYTDILPKYANATGGEIFSEMSREAIEGVYARAFGEARNQYTLGYNTKAVPSSNYRQIEVKVSGHGPSCHSSYRPCVDVTAKDGYYLVPVAR